MPREAAFEKGRRLLLEGRVRILRVDEENGEVQAEVRGDTARIYTVWHDREDGWHCDCSAYGNCSHRRAVQLVVVVR